MNFLYLLLASVIAMTQEQKIISRNIMKSQFVPPWSAVIDSVLYNQLAFTDIQQSKVYIDCGRLRLTPNTYKNVMLHEARHLLGAMHGDGSLAMNYSAVMDIFGNVVNDRFLLLPYLGN